MSVKNGGEFVIGVGTIKAFDTLDEYIADFENNGILLGETDGGSVLKISGTYEEIRTDGSMAPKTVIKTQSDISLEAVVKNTSKAMLALNLPEFADEESQLVLYKKSMVDLYDSAKVVVVRPDGQTGDEFDYIIHKGVFQSDPELANNKNELSGISIVIKAIDNDNAGENEKIITIRRKVA